MNDLSIRITHRVGDHEQSVDIDLPAPASVLQPIGHFQATEPAATAPDRFTPRDGIVHDALTGLEWSQEDVTSEPVNWKQADTACRDLRLGGHSDWRLPTRAELLTLVDDTRHEPAIDTSAFPNCKSAWYWTATPYNPSPSGYAWFVGFYGGYAGNGHRGDLSRVRAVRGPARQFLAV